MRTFGSWAGALLGAALATACDGGPAQPTGADVGRDADGAGDVAQGPACAWALAAPELTLPQGEVKGTLRGTSRNLSTTCTRQKVTGGPEAIYLLRLTERTLLDIEVVSEMDTVLAIRRVCDDPLTELACSDDTGGASGSPLPGFPDAAVSSDPVDAGSPLPGPDARNAHLRATLEAGNYFLLVDEAAPFGVGGEFRLEVHTSPPPAQTGCGGAVLVSDGSRLVDEELDLARDVSTCAGGEPRPALFYRAVIPSGQRLIARAVPTAGDRAWTPVLQAFTSCSPDGASDAGANRCLARDRADSKGQPVLHHDNNGPTDEVVLLSVSADVTVHGARFRLDVAIPEPLQNLTCATARPLSDGLVLRNQDLSEGQPEGIRCRPAGTRSLFYSATLYPQQWVHVQVDSVLDATAQVWFSVREGCSDARCIVDYNGGAGYLNNHPVPRTVILEATSDGIDAPTFDMSVLMPLPPGAISVAAARGLTTSEAGGQATFEVALASPAFGPVDIPIVSNDPAEGTASPATLHFTADNWQTPQTVTVTGVDDSARDGHESFSVTIGPSVSEDPRYVGVTGSAVALMNRDDEPGFTFDGPAVLQTSESGASSTFRVVLNREPSATVRLALSSSDEGEGKVDPAELVFDPGNWNQAQPVTLTGIDDDGWDGNRSYEVVTGAATSADPRYEALDPPDLDARNADNDYERVAAQVVSAGLYCNDSPWLGLAADQAANLYAAMSCQDSASLGGDGVREPTAFVAVSLDGGRTFGSPVDTGLPADRVAVAGVGPGVAVVVASSPTGIAVVRTEDAGVTWQPAVKLRSGAGAVRMLAAAGQRMLLSLDTSTGQSWWLSEDGGRTFQLWRSDSNGEIVISQGLDPDGTIWIVDTDYYGRFFFRTSGDGGKTFQTILRVPDGSRWVSAGPGLVFAAAYTGKELVVLPRDGSGSAQSIPGLPESINLLGLLADEHDNLVVLSSVSTGIDARRLGSGEARLSTGRSIGASLPYRLPWGVALSDKATAVVLGRDGQVSVAVETWP